MWELILITDWDSYLVAEVEAVSPSTVSSTPGTNGAFALTFRPCGEPMSMKLAQAKRAFLGIHVPELQKTWIEWGVAGQRPNLERPLVQGLIAHAWPEIADNAQRMEEVMNLRFKHVDQPIVPPVVSEKNLQQAAELDEEVVAELDKIVKSAKKGGIAGGDAAGNASGSSGGSAGGSAGGASASTGPRLPTKVVPPPPAGQNCSVEWARQYIPPNSTIHRDDRLHLRWIVHLPNGDQQYFTKAWSEDVTPMMALKICLKNAWAESARKKNGEVWFDIDSLPVEKRL